LDKKEIDSDLLAHLLDKSKVVNLFDINLGVRAEQVLKGLGMKQSDADNYLLDLIDELIFKCKELASPRAAYLLYEKVQFKFTRSQTFISGTELKTGKIVTSFLKKSTALILFSSTCGGEVESFSKKLMKNNHALEGFIVDLIGSELAESIAGYIQDKIQEKLIGVGYGVTNRFSPGYCNWPVSDQQKLFPLLRGNNCGIELTPSSLMLPIKSISGIFGIGDDVKRAAYKCRICNDEYCIMREKD
jgi:hypothetical protein